MFTIIVVFPPGSGGNHLRNLIAGHLGLENHQQLLDMYRSDMQQVHLLTPLNLTQEKIQQALESTDCPQVLHGHFAEIMTHYDKIKQIKNKKIVLISPDNYEDRCKINQRYEQIHKMKRECLPSDYYDQEQVFLYQANFFRMLFPESESVVISTREWFQPNIDKVLQELNLQLGISIDIEWADYLHYLWFKKFDKLTKIQYK